MQVGFHDAASSVKASVVACILLATAMKLTPKLKSHTDAAFNVRLLIKAWLLANLPLVLGVEDYCTTE